MSSLVFPEYFYELYSPYNYFYLKQITKYTLSLDYPEHHIFWSSDNIDVILSVPMVIAWARQQCFTCTAVTYRLTALNFKYSSQSKAPFKL